MSAIQLARVRKSYHLLRRRLGAGRTVPGRLVIEKAKWLNDARSPVMLMVDDLTNAWHNRRGGDAWEPGGDWGGGFRHPQSALACLEEGLRAFPDVKVTFFTVAGPIASYTHDRPFTHAAPLDATDESRRFFRSLAADPRYELAYHGFDHGTPGERSDRFTQEWAGFTSVEAAVAQTARGRDIFVRALGAAPRGGKYGGWAYNEFAEDAVNRCGFLWWCRDWTPRDVHDRVSDGYYEPACFGENLVVALPSTVHGHLWDRRQIDLLLRRRQVISIAEHIAPVRPDGRTQTPNIVDDMHELRRLFQYLSGKPVWHATGSEIASYVIARDRSIVYDVARDAFSIRYDGRVARPLLTLTIDCAAMCTPDRPAIDVTLPDGVLLDRGAIRVDRARYRHMVTLPVMSGRYRLATRQEAR